MEIPPNGVTLNHGSSLSLTVLRIYITYIDSVFVDESMLALFQFPISNVTTSHTFRAKFVIILT